MFVFKNTASFVCCQLESLLCLSSAVLGTASFPNELLRF